MRKFGGIIFAGLFFLAASISFAGPPEEKQWNHWAIKLPMKIKTTYPCEGYKIVGSEHIYFNKNEIRLICGDPKVHAWNIIPKNQAKYNITNFLQDRGYFYPTFTEDDIEVVVDIGEKTDVKKVIINGEYTRTLRPKRKRGLIGSTLTPSFLSSFESWIQGELANQGYPCTNIESSGEAYTGDVVLNIDSGCRQNFPPIQDVEVPEFNSKLLNRYNAFRTGKPFNQMLLSLTTRRIEQSGIAQSAYFIPKCNKQDFTLTRKTIPGKPRLFIFGIGADTEEYIKLRLSWKHSRLGKGGSSLQFQGRGSYRRQEFIAQSNWYFLNKPSRWFLMPRFKFERRYERKYNYISYDTYIMPSMTYDNEDFKLAFQFGPELSYKNTYKGADRGLTHFLSGVIRLNITSHDYEYYDYEPRNGYTITFDGRFNTDSIYSTMTVQKLKLYWEWLWNVDELSPPLFIMGMRGKLATSIINRNDPNFGRLPPDYRYYLGGSQDLRGFKREDLPNEFNNALTQAYIGFEGRFTGVLPLDFQPLLFVDFGALGDKSFKLNSPVYWSPGVGVRWPSFVGVFRLTMAHGFMINNKSAANNGIDQWQFYFSYGEEF